MGIADINLVEVLRIVVGIRVGADHNLKVDNLVAIVGDILVKVDHIPMAVEEGILVKVGHIPRAVMGDILVRVDHILMVDILEAIHIQMVVEVVHIP